MSPDTTLRVHGIDVVLTRCPEDLRGPWEAMGEWLAHTVALLTTRATGDRPVIHLEPSPTEPKVAVAIILGRGRTIGDLIGRGGAHATLLRDFASRLARGLDLSLVVHITDLERDDAPPRFREPTP